MLTSQVTSLPCGSYNVFTVDARILDVYKNETTTRVSDRNGLIDTYGADELFAECRDWLYAHCNQTGELFITETEVLRNGNHHVAGGVSYPITDLLVETLECYNKHYDCQVCCGYGQEEFVFMVSGSEQVAQFFSWIMTMEENGISDEHVEL